MSASPTTPTIVIPSSMSMSTSVPPVVSLSNNGMVLAPIPVVSSSNNVIPSSAPPAIGLPSLPSPVTMASNPGVKSARTPTVLGTSPQITIPSVSSAQTISSEGPAVRAPSTVNVNSPTGLSPLIPPSMAAQSKMPTMMGSASSPQIVTPGMMGIDQSSTPANLETALEEKGFTITDRIFVGTDGTDAQGVILKATTTLGQTVLIRADVQSNIVFAPDSKVMKESVGGTMVPESKIRSAWECAQKGGCGVGFICDGEVCVTSRPLGSVDRPTSIVLTSGQVENGEVARISGNPSVYPVVHASDSLRKPLATMAAIETVTRDVRNMQYHECVENRKILKESINKAALAAKEYTDLVNISFGKLANEIKALQKARSEYVRISPLSPEDSVKATNVVTRLQDYNERVVRLISLCSLVPSAIKQLNETTVKFKEASNMIREQSI